MGDEPRPLPHISGEEVIVTHDRGVSVAMTDVDIAEAVSPIHEATHPLHLLDERAIN